MSKEEMLGHVELASLGILTHLGGARRVEARYVREAEAEAEAEVR